MAEADLDVVIRSIAKKQHKILMDAAKKRHGRLMGLAAKAKTKEIKARYKQTAKDHAAAGRRRGKAVAGHGRECRRQLRARHEESGGREQGRGSKAGQEGRRTEARQEAKELTTVVAERALASAPCLRYSTVFGSFKPAAEGIVRWHTNLTRRSSSPARSREI